MSPVFDRETMPSRIRALPLDERGYPVPWFVATIDGRPDFRVIAPGRIEAAIRNAWCWVCGGQRSVTDPAAFVIGPMCAVNRTTAEPPSHRECATWSAIHCPFLSIPKMHRRDNAMPEDAKVPAGVSIRRNPGVALVWFARAGSWRPFADPSTGGYLFNVGEPVEVAWYAEGRKATRDEVLASIDSGLPILRDMAVDEGPEAMVELMAMHDRALALVPA
jgi:hypothetical protein